MYEGKSLNPNYEWKLVELQSMNYQHEEKSDIHVGQDCRGNSLSVGYEGASLKFGSLMVTVQ